MRDFDFLRSLGLSVFLLGSAFSALSSGGCARGMDTSEGTPASTTIGSGGHGDGGAGGSDFATGSGGGEACVAEVVEAVPSPLDLILLVDESSSMVGTKWSGTVAALNAFLTEPASDGLGVGLIFFPKGTGPAACDESIYQNFAIPIGELPLHAPVLTTAINAESPVGTATPLQSALEGALSLAMAHKDANPERKVILVLATDGVPTCVTNTNIELPASAAQALAYNGIETYVIAIAGSDIAQLNEVAQAGGTGQAYDVTMNIQDFSQKMAEIRTTALPCEILIPPPPAGEVLDPGMVNLAYTPGDGGPAETIPYVATQADCGSDAGWYYDDPLMPTKIIFCPATCDTVKADQDGRIDVAFGCATELK